ncbi:hypothetical protein QR680_004229 [Steinernema hermaphroditum]|uniref:7TM GPCR serpentine receptor class x (Srx) domain-containing protein n=1 Tax=Steinernema hermaphroditum TaxID=289476 RepID=A0AA39LTB4_9BILA|nr:hypothetical protein QR680_004229 [Steinernema hermaphroditum]
MEAKEIIIEIPCPSPGSPLIAQNLSSLNSQLIRYKPQICDDSQEFDGIKTEREIGVPVLIFLLSLCAIFFNAIAWYGVSKSKIFGKSYGIMMRMRSSVEIVAALITFGFFGTHVFFGYSVDIWMNAALTTFYVFLLSNAYLLHYAISINRLVSIYFPMRYADIFEEKKCVFVVVALILIFSSIISSLSFTDRCSYFVFSKELYDIVPVGCKDVKSSKISNHIVVIIWAVCAFSSLVLDVITLLRIAVYSRTNLWREYLKEKYGCVFEKKPAQSVNPVYDVVPSKPVTIAAIILGLSLCAIILNALLLHFIRKNRIFGKSYGTLLRMRSIVEILASFIAVGFFSTLVYLDYDIPIWANSTLTSFYTFMLSNAYFLHFLISFNRLFCIYFPGRYDEIFEIGWRIRIIKVLVLFLSALITSLPFYTPCSYFMFSRVIYDILPVGCERKESSKATNHVVVALHVRYAYLGAHYVGEFKSEVSVSGVHDCTLLAFNEKRIGYRVTVNGLQITCALLTDFIRFAPVSDKNVRDYILSANLDNKICKVDMQRNVTEFVNGPCTFGGGDCSMLDKIKDYCIFVGTDKYNCISETEQDTVRSIECPAGQERVDLKKEKVLCCLKGELFIKEQDGKAFCCPRSKKLKEIVNGKAVCCSSTESHQPGASLCCAPGLTYSENNGTANCCKAGLLASKSKDGQVGCCPAGKEFGGMVDGKAICCNPGEIYESGKTFCCPPGTNYSIGLSGDSGAEGIERCCPPRTYPTKSESGDIGCCRDEYKFIRNDGTRDVCCFGSSNYEFHRMLDVVMELKSVLVVFCALALVSVYANEYRAYRERRAVAVFPGFGMMCVLGGYCGRDYNSVRSFRPDRRYGPYYRNQYIPRKKDTKRRGPHSHRGYYFG